MSRDYRAFLDDVLVSVARIREYAEGLSREKLESDSRTLDAIVRNLEIIGEAIKKVPQDVRDRYPAVEWKKIGALRDILIHQYFGIDLDIIWDIVSNKLDPLSEQVERILNE